MEINIRFAESKDAEQISKLYEGWEEFQGILPPELLQLESTEEISNSINNPKSIKKYIIAESKDNILGVCYIDISFISLKTVRISYMFVNKEFRNKGIGSLLVDKVIDYAKTNNIKKIWLWTQVELTPAIKLYEKKGFILEGKQKNQFCNKDALLYGLVLD